MVVMNYSMKETRYDEGNLRADYATSRFLGRDGYSSSKDSSDRADPYFSPRGIEDVVERGKRLPYKPGSIGGSKEYKSGGSIPKISFAGVPELKSK